MLSRRVTVGDFCWGGVRHCFPSSSSDVEDTSSPMSIRSKLPSSTPFPSHRPQGNLQRAQDKHSSATHTGQPDLKAGGQLAPNKHCPQAGNTQLPQILTKQNSAGAAPAPQLIILRNRELCKVGVTHIFHGPHIVFCRVVFHLQPQLIFTL